MAKSHFSLVLQSFNLSLALTMPYVLDRVLQLTLRLVILIRPIGIAEIPTFTWVFFFFCCKNVAHVLFLFYTCCVLIQHPVVHWVQHGQLLHGHHSPDGRDSTWWEHNHHLGCISVCSRLLHLLYSRHKNSQESHVICPTKSKVSCNLKNSFDYQNIGIGDLSKKCWFT